MNHQRVEGKFIIVVGKMSDYMESGFSSFYIVCVSIVTMYSTIAFNQPPFICRKLVVCLRFTYMGRVLGED